MEFPIGTVLIVLMINSLVVLREKHKRRLSEANLEIVKTVTEIEKMMLARELCDGDVCHDTMHKKMLRSQYGNRYVIKWKKVFSLSKPTIEWEELKKRLEAEIQKDTQLGKIMRRYVKAEFKAFHNQRPIASVVFWGWFALQCGGLVLAVAGILTVLKTMTATQNFFVACRHEWSEIKVTAAEWYATGQMLKS